MKKITKSVIKLSELPADFQYDKIFDGYKIGSYAEFHIDDSENDELTLWLLKKYPTLKRKISFLIHIDDRLQMEILGQDIPYEDHSNYISCNTGLVVKI